MTTTSTLGQLIRETRLAKGMSMGQLASAVGRTAASVRRWERDEIVPPADVAVRLAEVLDLDLELLQPGPQGADEAEAPETERDTVHTESTALPETPEPDVEPPQMAQEATTIAAGIEVVPETERRSIKYFLDHLLDPDRPYLGYVRAALTVLVALVLLWILIWAVGELIDALGRVWDQFDREETETSALLVGMLR